MVAYPSDLHRKAAEKFVELFSVNQHVESILLVGSCARGRATTDSCVDITILLDDMAHASHLEKEVGEACMNVRELKELEGAGRFSHLDLNLTDGKLLPVKRGWTSGPDNFELEIGNTFVYSHLLYDRRGRFEALGNVFLPYYDETLRKRRLAEVKRYMFNNLEHIPLYAGRGLHFQCLERLLNASREYLQALFISRKTYPIAYDKWIKEQMVEILDMPEAYIELTSLFQIGNLESDELVQKATLLRSMAERDILQ
ncbi:MAG: nucleotidyltransferase domain-containing protein [Thermoplasmata archaeon]|nr:nucleotidyltransferase domain-containing protein [Candidatus Sysuiplasma acidicola]MDH2905449.1 nucleotidyltransferase domain-containing protein [Methanomassiliicoccales archaeon]